MVAASKSFATVAAERGIEMWFVRRHTRPWLEAEGRKPVEAEADQSAEAADVAEVVVGIGFVADTAAAVAAAADMFAAWVLQNFDMAVPEVA